MQEKMSQVQDNASNLRKSYSMSAYGNETKTNSVSNAIISSAAPAFLEKLYDLLADQSGYQEYIKWQPDGKSFLIIKATELQEQVLPKYFKHNNLQSFIRQLNMYCFSKTTHDSNYREFKHNLFQRDRKDLLQFIKRKAQNSKSQQSNQQQQHYINDTTSVNQLDDSVDENNEISQALHTHIYNLNERISVMEDRYNDLFLNHQDLLATVTRIQSSVGLSSEGTEVIRKVSVDRIDKTKGPISQTSGLNFIADAVAVVSANNTDNESEGVLIKQEKTYNDTDGVATLYRTLSKSLQEDNSFPSENQQGGMLKRQKSFM